MKIKKIAAAAAAAFLLLLPGAGYISVNEVPTAATAITAYADYEEYSYDEETVRSSDSDGGKNYIVIFIVSLAIGLIFAAISVGSMKSQMKTVRSQSGASSYKKAESFKLNESTDTFLYKKVDKSPRAGSAQQQGARPSPPPAARK